MAKNCSKRNVLCTENDISGSSSILEILENPAGRGQKRPGSCRKRPGKGQEEARTGQEEARKRPEEAHKRSGRSQKEARRGQEEAGRGQEEEEARKRPEEAQKRPRRGQKRPGRGQEEATKIAVEFAEPPGALQLHSDEHALFGRYDAGQQALAHVPRPQEVGDNVVPLAELPLAQPEEARKRPGKGQKRPGEAPKGQESRIWRKIARNAMFYEQKMTSLGAFQFWRFWRILQEEARRGQEEAGRGPEEARKRPEEVRKRPRRSPKRPGIQNLHKKNSSKRNVL